MVRIGVVPRRMSLQECTNVAVRAVDVGADGVFATDHVKARALGDERASLPWPMVLGSVRARRDVIVGPEVARCGVGNDARIIQALEVLAEGGEVVAFLGVGDGIGRAEHRRHNLPWPARAEREAAAIATARLCHQQQWPTYVSTKNPAFVARAPHGVGVHTLPDDPATIHQARPVAVSLWAGQDPLDWLVTASREGWDWLTLTQQPNQPNERFVALVAATVAARDNAARA